jgi:hypothetical protein
MTICCIRVTPATFFHPLDDLMSQFIQSPRPPLAGLYSIFNGGPLKDGVPSGIEIDFEFLAIRIVTSLSR